MIEDLSGTFVGRKNDHIKQGESHLSDRLVACQVGNVLQYNTSTDKGEFKFCRYNIIIIHKII